MPLSDQERAILELERSWWREPGSKEARIRDRLGLSTTRYYRLVGALIDSADAFAYDPLVVLRLRRERDRRRRARYEGRSADGPRAR
ncbi:MAG TPA: DUF3263 domain-containing protein [Acidimicrobiales bacterium]|nr:DUF3263 domain-containing protein [Acidimicrobiales bacterium]